MILEEITQKLQEVDPAVFYGMVDAEQITDEWNYIVFLRKSLRSNQQKQSYSDVFTVAVVRENYIPEGMDVQIIDKMCEIAGMRLSDAESQYSYTMKPNTNTVVELLTIEFVKPRKKG